MTTISEFLANTINGILIVLVSVVVFIWINKNKSKQFRTIQRYKAYLKSKKEQPQSGYISLVRQSIDDSTSSSSENDSEIKFLSYLYGKQFDEPLIPIFHKKISSHDKLADVFLMHTTSDITVRSARAKKIQKLIVDKLRKNWSNYLTFAQDMSEEAIDEQLRKSTDIETDGIYFEKSRLVWLLYLLQKKNLLEKQQLEEFLLIVANFMIDYCSYFDLHFNGTSVTNKFLLTTDQLPGAYKYQYLAKKYIPFEVLEHDKQKIEDLVMRYHSDAPEPLISSKAFQKEQQRTKQERDDFWLSLSD